MSGWGKREVRDLGAAGQVGCQRSFVRYCRYAGARLWAQPQPQQTGSVAAVFQHDSTPRGTAAAGLRHRRAPFAGGGRSAVFSGFPTRAPFAVLARPPSVLSLSVSSTSTP